MILKNLEIPDILPAIAGKAKIILAAQIPTHKLGRITDFITKMNQIKLASEYARMDAIPGAMLVSKISYRFVRKQIALRPRMRLAALAAIGLMFSLIPVNNGVDTLEAKKSEIKVNGQAVLIAEPKLNDEEAQIDAEITHKELPFNFQMPVGGYVSQGYHGYHRAVDIATGRVGVPIAALGKGKVEFAGFLADGKGNVVIVDHGDGLKSLYAHMGQIKVAVGNDVDEITPLGTVGLTGRTTGAHVHLEVYDNGIAVDPSKVLPEPENPLGLAPKAEALPQADYSDES